MLRTELQNGPLHMQYRRTHGTKSGPYRGWINDKYFLVWSISPQNTPSSPIKMHQYSCWSCAVIVLIMACTNRLISVVILWPICLPVLLLPYRMWGVKCSVKTPCTAPALVSVFLGEGVTWWGDQVPHRSVMWISDYVFMEGLDKYEKLV